MLAVCNIYLTNVFEFWGLQYLTSSKTCFIYSLSPFISALFSYFLLAEVVSKKKWLGFIIGFIGFIPLLLSTTHEENLAGTFFVFSWAELAVVAATITSVYGWILLKQLVKDEGLSPSIANGIAMLLGGSLALGHSRLTETWNPIPVTDLLPFFKCTLFLIVVSNCICYNLYGYLLKRYSATFMSFAGLTTPLFSALFGWLILGETTTIAFWLSFTLLCFGLVIFYQEELKQEKLQIKKVPGYIAT